MTTFDRESDHLFWPSDEFSRKLHHIHTKKPIKFVFEPNARRKKNQFKLYAKMESLMNSVFFFQKVYFHRWRPQVMNILQVTHLVFCVDLSQPIKCCSKFSFSLAQNLITSKHQCDCHHHFHFCTPFNSLYVIHMRMCGIAWSARLPTTTEKTMSIREILSAIFLCYCCCCCGCFLLLHCTSFYQWWSSRMIRSFMKRVCDHCIRFVYMWHTHLWLTIPLSCAFFSIMNESKRKEHFDIMFCIMLARKMCVRNWVHWQVQ